MIPQKNVDFKFESDHSKLTKMTFTFSLNLKHRYNEKVNYLRDVYIFIFFFVGFYDVEIYFRGMNIS